MARVWSLLVVAGLIALWLRGLETRSLLYLSLLALGYFLFVARTPCGAVNIKGRRCSRNARGLLGSCGIAQHRDQKFGLAPRPAPSPRPRHRGRVAQTSLALSVAPDRFNTVCTFLSLLVALLAWLLPNPLA